MNRQIVVSDIKILVERKNIKNMYLRVLPPDGAVKMTVPNSITDTAIRRFAESKISWIKKGIETFETKKYQGKPGYVSGEIHFLWGKPYHLEVVDSGAGKDIYLKEDKIIMQVRKESTPEQREYIMEEWYRKLLKQAIPTALTKCVKIVGKAPDEWRVKNMKTKWGTCNITKKRIWLNLQLAKKPPECLDYVITHELVHLYVKNHNDQFKAYMNQFYPNWKTVKKKLNEQQCY